MKQLRWKTVPSARTNAPCIGFPQAEHVLHNGSIRYRHFYHKAAHVEAKLAEVEALDGGGPGFEWFEESENEVTLS